MHLLLQVRFLVPQLPQAWVSVLPEAQTPWLVHELQDPHWHLELQVRFFLPQVPQAWVSA